MKYLRQLAIILGICYLGFVIQRLFNLPVPGNILGMIILLGGLLTGIIRIDMIREVSDFLLDHLGFFFIPGGVGLISYMGILKTYGIAIIIVCFITTIIIMGITGRVVQRIIRRGKNDRTI